MSPSVLLFTVISALAVVFVLRYARKAAITPSSIRIQSMENPQEGHWVLMPGFRELGSPCFSRDGDWIAFDAYKEGYNNSSAECWIARKDGQDLARLTVGATPRWSPDGKQLLFVRERANNRRLEEGIFVIDQGSQNELRIGDGRWPDWSPDGKEIVFSVGGKQRGGARVGAMVCIAGADGSGRREIVEGDCPSWSPDGTKIAYCFRTGWQLPTIRVYDLRERQVTTLGTGCFRANWMPDCSSVVANGVLDGGWKMVRFLLEPPGKLTELTTEFSQPFSPCYSRDGQQMVFIAKRPEPVS